MLGFVLLFDFSESLIWGVNFYCVEGFLVKLLCL